jgi:putative metallophosphoesterase
MKVLIIGDIVGQPGRNILFKFLEKRKQNYDFIIVNGENSAGGFGINIKIAEQFFQRGTDVITLGNHSWDKREIYPYINEHKNLIRPLNFAEGAPGNGYTIVAKNGIKVAVINAQGKVFMPPIACPFLAVEEVLPKIKEETDIIILDFHGEATSEKQAMGWNLTGKVSVVYGTHTHTQTADERILPGGTAYISDVGMTGGHDGILGMNRRESIQKFKDGMPARYSVCEENPRINGIEVEIDEKTGKAISIERVNMGYDEV